MFAANSLSGVFPILDKLRSHLEDSNDYTVEQLAQLAAENYQKERRMRAEGEYLVPRGLTLETFLSNGKAWLPEITFRELDRAVSDYRLEASLLICGFDTDGLGHIFTVEDPGRCDRRDIPGFHAIGSGFYGALYMMYYRELSYFTPAYNWLYYIYEAKGFGEQAGAVGGETELLLAKPNEPIRRIDKDGYHLTLERIWTKRRPGGLDSLDMRALKRVLTLPASPSAPGSTSP